MIMEIAIVVTCAFVIFIGGIVVGKMT